MIVSWGEVGKDVKYLGLWVHNMSFHVISSYG